MGPGPGRIVPPAVRHAVLEHVQAQLMGSGDQGPIVVGRAQPCLELVIVAGLVGAGIFDGHDPDRVAAQGGDVVQELAWRRGTRPGRGSRCRWSRRDGSCRSRRRGTTRAGRPAAHAPASASSRGFAAAPLSPSPSISHRQALPISWTSPGRTRAWALICCATRKPCASLGHRGRSVVGSGGQLVADPEHAPLGRKLGDRRAQALRRAVPGAVAEAVGRVTLRRVDAGEVVIVVGSRQ